MPKNSVFPSLAKNGEFCYTFEKHKPMPEAEKPAQAAPTGPRILIVEDERPLAHALELKLGHEGYQTMTASTGKQALEMGGSGQHDLILLDLILPELDGFTILKELKAKGIKAPIVILSNLGQSEDQVKAKELGAADYLVKSNAPLSEIIALIKKLLAQ